MQKAVRYYVVTTAVILCLTLLFCGIISVREETNYVISGEREDVLKVQSTTSERLIITDTGEDTEIHFPDRETFLLIISGILPSPLSQIVWGLGGNNI